MALNFPNPSRSYEESEYGVRFWGYDQTFEISFFVEAGALAKINSGMRADQAGFLNTFDVNREQILAVAGGIYTRRRKAPKNFSYTLTAADF